MESDSRQTQGNASTKGLELRAVGDSGCRESRIRQMSCARRKQGVSIWNVTKKCEMGGGQYGRRNDKWSEKAVEWKHRRFREMERERE